MLAGSTSWTRRDLRPRPLAGRAVTGPAAGLGQTGARLGALLGAELPAAIELRHELHQNPELSGSEARTAATVAAAMGAPDSPVIASTGRLIRIGPADGPAI